MGKYFQSPVKIYLDSCVINIQKIVEKVPFENIVIQLITPSKQKYFADPKKEKKEKYLKRRQCQRKLQN